MHRKNEWEERAYTHMETKYMINIWNKWMMAYFYGVIGKRVFESKFPYDLFKLQIFMIKLVRNKDT